MEATNVTLRYRASGVGDPRFPGASAWNTTLGRHWSHDGAERIVEDPDEFHVWLLTRDAVFREFTDVDQDGTYEVVSPSNEYRILTKTASGWDLTTLEGTVQWFDANGRWTQTADSNGNTTTATYAAGELDGIAFPDGRTETFFYHPTTGKLDQVTETGVDGTTTRDWTYLWSADDLERIDLPDGRALRFEYNDTGFPGYMTAKILVGDDGTSERVLQAWEYDTSGNVAYTWKGDTSRTGPDATEVWGFVYDDPADPTQTSVTDPRGDVTIYDFDRDPVSDTPRVTAIDGTCPSCGISSDVDFLYDDANNPLLPTQMTDARGHVTKYTYNSDGRMLSKTEAFGTAVERTTNWEYNDPSYPGLTTRIERPSTTGNPSDLRVDILAYDASGNLEDRTREGFEDGSSFSYLTEQTFNAAGQVTSIDPPGYGTADITSFTYDPTRGSLLADSRDDPIIGATASTQFDYDPFNRRDSVIDVNGVETSTLYDLGNRVTFVTQLGATMSDDLVTENEYNTWGDVERTILPEGNVLEYGYDPAGRLESIARGPAAGPLQERTFYVLGPDGNRTREDQDTWNGSAWETQSTTTFEYDSRCHLSKIVYPDGSVREHQYDCNGNLENVWDENHPSAGQSATPSMTYVYDALDRLSSVTQPWGGAGGGSVVTSYGYDDQDHLTSVTDGEGNTTTYVYSDRDLLTSEISPASGTTTHVYNEHGELTSTTDARSVTVTRTVDALDRVELVDFPTASLDIDYVYDQGSFGLGRLSSITRDSDTVAYTYDRFGRVVQDGDLALTYDKNSNRETITYPAGPVATYTHDYADRQASLDVDPGSGSVPVVTASSYYPSGPLMSLTLGNGVVETRTHDSRYFPDEILLTGALPDWTYTDIDGVGNILEIFEDRGCTDNVTVSNQTITGTAALEACTELTLGPALTTTSTADVVFLAGDEIVLTDGTSLAGEVELTIGTASGTMTTRSLSYQDQQYYLTGASGAPWDTLGWSYDRIGNRLTEDRNGTVDTYTYLQNGTSGNTPLLDTAGPRDYTFDASGNLMEVDAAGNVIDFTFDDASRMSRVERALASEEASQLYDGRSFLRRAETPIGGGNVSYVDPSYSSDGLLQALSRRESPTEPIADVSVFYFAGRPVAQWFDDGASTAWTYLHTDHLGTPMSASDASGDPVWVGPFEPFGEDPLRLTADGALENGVFLRLPGQWDDAVWRTASLGAEAYYNVYRWYESQAGRYSRVDPVGLPEPLDLDINFNNLFQYATANPLVRDDPLGLVSLGPGFSRRCRRRWREKILPQLQSPSPRCQMFFCRLSTDISALVGSGLPVINPRKARGGEFLRGTRIVELHRSLLCRGSTKETLAAVFHEIGHYSDFWNNDDEFASFSGVLPHHDGCGAEIACVGRTVAPLCKSLYYPAFPDVEALRGVDPRKGAL